MSFDDVHDAATDFARSFNHGYYQPLHSAILKGDWDTTKAFFDNDPSALTAKITMIGRTAVHVAAFGHQWKLLEKLIQHVPEDVLAELDLMGCSCLHYVAITDSIGAAKTLVAKNPSLTQVTDFKGFTPLIHSLTSTRSKDMVWYLVLNTTDDTPACPFSGPTAAQLVALLTTAGFRDITMYLFQKYPNLATLSDTNGSIILNVLSKLPSHFQSGHKLGFFERFIYNFVPVGLEYLPPNHLRGNVKDSYGGDSNHHYFGSIFWNALQIFVPSIRPVREAKFRDVSSVRLVEFVCSQASTMNDSQFWQTFVSPNIIFNATSSGIVEMLRIYFQFFPDLVWTHIPNEGNVVQIAIKNRQEKVFSLLRKRPTILKLLVLQLDESQNTTSHMVARLASPQVTSISGATFQMQRELQWFKEVEKLDHPLHQVVKNQDGKTPWQVFKEEHKALLDEEKNWMKDTSNSLMLVATLIATVVFAASITVPGGNNQDKGIPIFLADNTFMVFIVSDALALFSSMASLLMFLAVLNARYAEEDFLMELPKKLILGLVFLSLAIVTTMISFGAALSLLLGERLKWSPIPIALLACIPIALFINLQLPLFLEMIISTYGSRIYHPVAL